MAARCAIRKHLENCQANTKPMKKVGDANKLCTLIKWSEKPAVVGPYSAAVLSRMHCTHSPRQHKRTRANTEIEKHTCTRTRARKQPRTYARAHARPVQTA